MLTWNWSDKIGEVEEVYINGEGKKTVGTTSIYAGNCFAVLIVENPDDTYVVTGFFNDKEHMKNCLGLSKGYTENIYNHEWHYWEKITIYKDKADKKFIKEFVPSVALAFDNIEVCITTSPAVSEN